MCSSKCIYSKNLLNKHIQILVSDLVNKDNLKVALDWLGISSVASPYQTFCRKKSIAETCSYLAVSIFL